METLNSPLFTKGTDDWATPQPLFDWLNMSFAFTLDPCATAENAKCTTYFTREQNGLVQSWADQRVFMNPPYSEVGKWMHKAHIESVTNWATVVCLTAARVDTKWFHHDVLGVANEIQFLPGRVSFLRDLGASATQSAPFPSMIVVYRPPVAREFLRVK